MRSNPTSCVWARKSSPVSGLVTEVHGQILTHVRDVRAISERATPPRLTQYNHWGQRIDQLDTSEAWKELKTMFFKEGIPGIFYERKYAEFSRIYGFAKLHMLVGDSHVVSRPAQSCRAVGQIQGRTLSGGVSDIYDGWLCQG